MDELRPEIRAAFEKEQAAHPPAASLRRNVVNAVAAQPRREPRLQWIAVATALLLGLGVVAGLMSSRLAHRGTVLGNPKASPVADYGPPPAGVPLLYVHDPNHPSWLIGYDWSGKPRGTVKLSTDLAQNASGVQMTPDGSGFEVGGTYKGGTGTFLDRLGLPISTQTGSTGDVGAMWADDNQHQCLVTLSPTFVWGLSTLLPGQAPRPVAVIAHDPGVGESGISLAACSFRNNQAILVRTTIAWPAELWVVRLSDGTVLAHHSYGLSDRLSTVVASRDGLYIAENSAKGPALDSPDTVQGAGSTTIRLVSRWSAIKLLDPSIQVLAFSANDRFALEIPAPSAQPEVLDWVADIRDWTIGSGETLGTFAVQPIGDGFALAFIAAPGVEVTPCGTTAQTACGGQVDDPLRDILIVHGGDGTSTNPPSTTQLPGRYVPTW